MGVNISAGGGGGGGGGGLKGEVEIAVSVVDPGGVRQISDEAPFSPTLIYQFKTEIHLPNPDFCY